MNTHTIQVYAPSDDDFIVVGVYFYYVSFDETLDFSVLEGLGILF